MQASTRRSALAVAAGLVTFGLAASRKSWAEAEHPAPSWYAQARDMQKLAESWGDQSFGAVLVFEGRAVGLGPSRVVMDKDPDAHAERVAIRDAQKTLGTMILPGSVLYSTSRPCAACEAAAARTGVSRMYHGASLADAGEPRLRGP